MHAACVWDAHTRTTLNPRRLVRIVNRFLFLALSEVLMLKPNLTVAISARAVACVCERGYCMYVHMYAAYQLVHIINYI